MTTNKRLAHWRHLPSPILLSGNGEVIAINHIRIPIQGKGFFVGAFNCDPENGCLHEQWFMNQHQERKRKESCIRSSNRARPPPLRWYQQTKYEVNQAVVLLRKEREMEEKEISRRDFVRKALQYATAGAVLGSMAGLEGVNPPEAEAAEGDFIYFMKKAQDNKDLTCDFINQVIGPNATAESLTKWFFEYGYNVNLVECEMILEICKKMYGGANSNGTMYGHVSVIEQIAQTKMCDPVQPQAY